MTATAAHWAHVVAVKMFGPDLQLWTTEEHFVTIMKYHECLTEMLATMAALDCTKFPEQS